MKKNDYECDFKFDWVLKKSKGELPREPVEDYKQQLRQKLEYQKDNTGADAKMADDNDNEDEDEEEV